MFIYTLYNLILRIKDTLIALLSIILMFIVIAVVVMMIRVIYPRTFWINHTKNLESYMEKYTNSVMKHIKGAQNEAFGEQCEKPTCVYVRSDYASSPNQKKLLQLLKNDENVSKDDVEFFLKFYEYHTSVSISNGGQGSWWYLRNERNIIPKLAPDSIKKELVSQNNPLDIDDTKMKAYVDGKMLWLRKVALLSRKEKDYIYQNFETIQRSIQDKKYISLVNDLDLLLNVYRPTLTFMFDTRKTYGFTLQFNIFRLYLSRYINNIVNRKIIRDTWGTFWKDVNDLNLAITFWYKSLEPCANNLPFYLGKFSNELCPEKFENNTVQIENFAFVVAPLVTIAVFFSTSITMVPKMIKMAFSIIKLLTDPFEMLVVIMGLILGINLFILYHLFSFLISIWSAMVSFIALLTLNVLFTALWIIILGLIFIVMTILWVLDLCTGGYVLGLLRCENLPDAWTYQNGFGNGNIYQRDFFCKTPCAESFSPGSGFCHKNDGKKPSFCPQQLIQQMVESDKPLPNKYIYQYSPSMKTWISSDKGKKSQLTKYIKGKTQFLKECFISMEKYDHITIHQCANVKELIPKDKQEEATKLCRQIYCEYKLNDGRRPTLSKRKPNEKEFFCPQIEDEQKEKTIDSVDIVTKVFHTATITIMLFLVLYTLYMVKQKYI